MTDVKIIPISREYRDGYEKVAWDVRDNDPCIGICHIDKDGKLTRINGVQEEDREG